MATEKLRLDKYLWSIRLFKSRTLATDACEKGKVKAKNENCKPSKQVSIGDEFEIKTSSKKWVIKVKELLHNRVQYTEAIKFYEDLTPAEELNLILSMGGGLLPSSLRKKSTESNQKSCRRTFKNKFKNEN